jgi:hypothetical protein
MSGPEFLALAWRLPAYDGVMAARIRAEEEKQEQEGPRTHAPTRRGRPAEERRVVDIHDPVFAGLIEWG